MTPTDITTILLLIISGFVVLQSVTWLVRRWLKLDSSEREQLLHSEIDQLSSKLEKYDKEVDSLRKQISLMVDQYEEAIGRLIKLQDLYKVSVDQNEFLRKQLEALSSSREIHPEKVLMVVIGSDDLGLSLDLASIRAVSTETGLKIQEITSPILGNLKKEIDLARIRKSHIYLHMAIRADENGYELGGHIVNATWLSSILQDVLILLVAGADSNYIGGFLGVVPYVITVSGDVGHREAANFSRAFWSEIGRGIGPTRAVARALDRSPEDIKNKIVCHWLE